VVERERTRPGQQTRAILRVAADVVEGTWSRDDGTRTDCSKAVAYYWDVAGAPASQLPAGSLPVDRPDKPLWVHG